VPTTYVSGIAIYFINNCTHLLKLNFSGHSCGLGDNRNTPNINLLTHLELLYSIETGDGTDRRDTEADLGI
jgi:hypothetical protein